MSSARLNNLRTNPDLSIRQEEARSILSVGQGFPHQHTHHWWHANHQNCVPELGTGSSLHPCPGEEQASAEVLATLRRAGAGSCHRRFSPSMLRGPIPPQAQRQTCASGFRASSRAVAENRWFGPTLLRKNTQDYNENHSVLLRGA